MRPLLWSVEFSLSGLSPCRDTLKEAVEHRRHHENQPLTTPLSLPPFTSSSSFFLLFSNLYLVGNVLSLQILSFSS
jgi:hypothetical protein